MCFPFGATQITRDMCFPGGRTRITRDMCFPGGGTRISRDICFPGGGTRITRDMCFPGGGTILTTRFPWVNGCVHHSTRVHRVSWMQKLSKRFPSKNASQYPWLGEEMRDWPCLKDLDGESVRGSLMREKFVSWNCTQSPALLRFMEENNTEQTTSRQTV